MRALRAPDGGRRARRHRAATRACRRALTGGAGHRPTARREGDLQTLARRRCSCSASCCSQAGAKRVMLNTCGYDELRSRDELERLDADRHRPRLRHARRPATRRAATRSARDRERGVVDPDFRVHGYENLHVCDASVFPTSLYGQPAAHRDGARALRRAGDRVSEAYTVDAVRVLGAARLLRGAVRDHPHDDARRRAA